MSDQTTTVKIGFRTDTEGLNQATRQISRVRHELQELRRASAHPAVSGRGGVIGGVTDRWRSAVRTRQELRSGVRQSPIGSLGAGMLRGGGGAFAALGLAMGAMAVITKAVGQAKQYLSVIDPLSKQLSIVGQGQDRFAESLERTGVAIGKNKTEMAGLIQTYVGLAGQQRGFLDSQVRTSALFAKGMGIDQNLMASSMGGMAQMGAFGSYGGVRAEQFAATLADAITRGGMKGREGELFSSIQSLMGAQLNVLTRLAPGSSTAMIGALTAMNASGRSGLMGVRGANVLGRMNSAFMNPQGDFGEYFMYNALGGGNYFDYKMRLEKGIFGDGNLQAVMDHMKTSVPNEKARWYTMSKMFGISMDQARGIEGLNLQGNSGFLQALEGATGGNLGSISADKLGLMAEIYNTSGSRREALLQDSRISGITKGKGWSAQTDINTILKGIIEGEMVSTENERLVSELTKIDNTIADIGRQMIPRMTDVVAGVNKLVDFFVGDKEKPPSVVENVRAAVNRPEFEAGAILGETYRGVKAGIGPTKEGLSALFDMELADKISSKIGSGVTGAFAPVMDGFEKLFSELGKRMKFDIRIQDDRGAGDGSAVKVHP